MLVLKNCYCMNVAGCLGGKPPARSAARRYDCSEVSEQNHVCCVESCSGKKMLTLLHVPCVYSEKPSTSQGAPEDKPGTSKAAPEEPATG